MRIGGPENVERTTRVGKGFPGRAEALGWWCKKGAGHVRLGWDEIKRRAKAFSAEHADDHYEKGETQTFYNDFFEIFGVKRRQVATYEQRVKLLNNKHGFMDLFWPKTLLIEQKSARLDLTKAGVQAMDYIDGIRAEDQPRYVLTCDFQTWNLLDLETSRTTNFKLPDLHKHVEAFAFILGRRVSFGTQAAVNIKAAELMGRLHDALEAANYAGHDLEQLLVRLLFCLFADDTGIFEPKDIFLQLIEADTREDGRDTGSTLIELFDVLDTEEAKRQTTLRAELRQFPYVNGALFAGSIRTPGFDKAMREMLLDAARFDWGKVSPAIFGSLFQSVMDAKERRAKGAHYTSEANILKVIGPLFLDDLKAEFAKIDARKTGRVAALQEFQRKLSRLTFLDPACGCGNFLVVAYRELRALELAVLHALWDGQRVTDTALFSLVNVDQFYGIEYEEFPARIAEVAMWMADHLANNEVSLAFGQSFARIPLKQSARIVHGDALEVDWADVLPPAKCSYVMGNPPFVGHQYRTTSQQAGMHAVWGQTGQFNRLDYVSAWFKQAIRFAYANKRIRIAFVATNSICQGEQAGILWPHLSSLGVYIQFAHRTFVWSNEASGVAAVHCVIVGIGFGEPSAPVIFDYPKPKGDPLIVEVKRINGYLIDGPFVTVPARTQAPAGLPRMLKGSQPTDGARLKKPEGGYITTSNLILDAEDRTRALERDPMIAKWLRPYVGGDELISGDRRWCLWLKTADPSELRQSQEIMERLERVRQGRLKSPTPSVRSFARTPSIFTQDRQPNQKYIGVPEVSSENREYIPIDFLEPDIIASNKLQIIPQGTLFHFGVLNSWMHMAWMRTVAGRLESRYSYSPTIYNTFPWPDATPAQRTKIETLAQAVLNARANHPTSSLADLYDPDTMPADLRRAHTALDTAIDRLYRAAPFASDRDRVEHLFGRYEALVNPLERVGIAKNRRVAKKAGVGGTS